MGIQFYNGLQNFNAYPKMDIPRVDFNEVKKQDELRTETTANIVEAPEPKTPVVDNRSKMANLDDISLSFNSNDDYSYIGSNADIGMLDMEKLISDMKKDSILEDYQYFVGSSQNTAQAAQSAGEDGMVFLKY